MKRNLTFAVLASVMLAACEKTDTAKSPDGLALKTPNALIASAETFFNNQIITSRSSLPVSDQKDFRNEVKKTPLWEKAYIKHDQTKGDIVIAPLKYEKPLHFKTNFGNGSILSLEKQSELWIHKDVSGKYKAEVRITLPNKMYQEGIVKSFEGYILEEDWEGNIRNKYSFKNGEVIKNLPTSSNTNNLGNKNIIECDAIDWYLCDYIDQFGVGTNCQYLYTEYINCEEVGDDGGGGDSGGGGGGGETGYCSTEEWSSGVTSVTDLESISTISEGPETRTKNYVWVFARGTFNPTLRWKSHETGVHIRDNNQWKWQSLTHNSVSKVGIIVGGSLQCDVNSATATVGIYNAIMAINYTFTWSLVCDGFPVSGSENKISAKSFNVND